MKCIFLLKDSAEKFADIERNHYLCLEIEVKTGGCGS